MPEFRRNMGRLVMPVWPQAIFLAAAASAGLGLSKDAPGHTTPLTTAQAEAVRDGATGAHYLT